MPAAIICPKKNSLPPLVATPISRKGSPKRPRPSYDSTALPTFPQPPCTPSHFKLIVTHPLPSLNAVLALGHWQRSKLKKAIQDSVLCALRVSESVCWTPITSSPSGTSTPSATLASYLAMRQTERESKRANKKLEAKQRKGRRSKS